MTRPGTTRRAGGGGPDHCGVDQLVDRRSHNPNVAGSSPAPANFPTEAPHPAIKLLDSWLSEPSDYDEIMWPRLRRRLSPAPAGRWWIGRVPDWMLLAAALLVALAAMISAYGCTLHVHLGGKYYGDDYQEPGLIITLPEPEKEL